MKILEIDRVSYRYRSGFWMKSADALREVSFSVPQGSVYGFLGANGAGKTTLIHLITGLRKAASGELRVFGLPAESPEAKRHLGYLPERPYFHDHLSGEGLLRFFAELSGMPKPQIAARITSVLEVVGMSHARKKLLRSYSKGMLQRIGIAQAILHDPDLLVLDEPMSGLDPVGRREIRELIRQLARGGKTIFFSSHVIPDVETICDHVALIAQGRLVRHGTLASFFEGEQAQFEIFLETTSADAIAGLPGVVEAHLLPSGQVRGLISGREQANAVLARAVQLGLVVREFNPKRASLEDFF